MTPTPATTQATARSPWLGLVVLLLTAWTVAPLWIAPGGLLPLVDVGSHLHLITLLHHHDSSELFQHHYQRVHAIVPYLGYYKLVDWLAYVGDWLAPQGAGLSWGIEWANRVVLSLCLAAVPQAALALLRASGHSRWLVLAVFPWLLNSDFWLGFVSFLLSIPLFLWTLAAHLRLLQRGGAWRAAFVAALLCTLSVTHYLLWSVALALLPVLALRMATSRHLPAEGRLRRLLWWPLRELLLGLPSIGVLLPWFLRYFVFAEGVKTSDQQVAATQGTLLERLSRVYGGEHLAPVDNLRQISEHLFNIAEPQTASGRWTQHPGELATLLWLTGFGLWIFGAAKQPHDPDRSSETKLGSSYVGWALFGVVLIYLIFPAHLVRPIILWGVNFRLIEVMAILGVVALPLQPLRPAATVRFQVWIGTGLLAGAALLVAAVAGLTVHQTQLEYGVIREAYDAIPPHKRVLTLRSKRTSAWTRLHIYNNIGEYYAVMRHGYVPYSFADTSSKPLVVDTKTALPAPPWDTHGQFSWQAHGRYYDYIALYDDVAGQPPSWYDDLPPWLERVFARGHWQVLRNPLPEPWPQWGPEDWRNWAAGHALEQAAAGLVHDTLQRAGLTLPLTAEQQLLWPWLAAVPFYAPVLHLHVPGWPGLLPAWLTESQAAQPRRAAPRAPGSMRDIWLGPLQATPRPPAAEVPQFAFPTDEQMERRGR